MRSFPSVQLPRSEPDADKVIRLYQSETAEILERPEPVRARYTVHIFGSLFVVMLLASMVLRLDRVVTSSFGQVVPTEATTVIQALDTSIIKSIDVHEGQPVKEGDLLATLDPTFTAADVDTLKTQLASLDAQIARCDAELAGRPYEPMPSPTAPGAGYYETLQRSYYTQRKAQFDAQVKAYAEQIGQLRATLARVENDQARYTDRAKLAKEVEDMRAALAASQVGSRLNLLAATDQKTELLRNLESDRNSLVESKHQLEATVATRDAFIQQWRGQTSQELVTARNQRDSAAQQLEKALRHQDLVKLYARDDGIVLKMAKLSVGSVLKDGDPLMYVAPMRSPVEAEARVAPRDIGFIRVGDPVMLKLDPFAFAEHGTAEGRVRWISEGAFNTDDNGAPINEPFYKVRVAFTKTDLRNVPPGFRLIPGMTLTTDIHIGTRSIFMYVLSGAIGGIGEAMREP